MSFAKFLAEPVSRFFLLILLVYASHACLAQKRDSMYLYEKIKNIADKSKFATMVYQAVFVEPKPREYAAQPESKEEKIVNPYLKFEGAIIRRVNVKVYDPFGHSVADTSKQRIDFFQQAGNELHVTSRHWVILNKLLFKKNESLNALSVSESERLLRQSEYVNDARIYITETSCFDSVDVNVIVQDKWAVSAPAMLTDVSANARFTNQNFLGTGQQFQQYAGFTKPGLMDYSGYYNVANINHTYISSRLAYSINKDGKTVGLSFDRPFFSPLAKWAGGASVYKSWNYFLYKDPSDGAPKLLPLNSSGYDLWLGKSFKINSKRKFFNESTNIIVGERYYTNVFDKRPSFFIDTDRRNLGVSSFISSVGLSVQQFYKERFIYRFGANEDVPQGLIVQVLYGATKREFGEMRYYSGLEIARAFHIKEGYFSGTFSYGMFYGKTKQNDITTNYKLNYFSDLFRTGKWYFREFINCNVVYGENKLASERITISAAELYGFNAGTLSGTTKMVMNIETVAYAPYNLAGFKFAPVLLTGLAMIGDDQRTIDKSNLYQAYALGLMLRNENLLVNTFQVSVGAYPFLPGGKNNVVSYNPVASFTLKIRAFSVSKPAFISY